MMHKKFKIIISVFLILIIASGTFLSSLNNGFVNWDDDRYLTENKVIQRLSWVNIRKIFTSFFHLGHYHPLTALSFMLECHFFKLNPCVYHLTNFILHLLNSLLVFWLFYLISARLSVSFITAILFAVHPLHVESVAWVSGRKELLYALFFLGAAVSYCYYLKRRPAMRHYYASLILFTLALLSKSMAVTLPIVLLFIDYIFYRKRDKLMLIDKIPFLFLSLAFGVTAVFICQRLTGSIFISGASNLLHRLMLACYSIIFYLFKIFAPVKLSCLYPYPGITGRYLSHIYIYSFLLVSALILAVSFSGRHTRKIIFGFAFFLVTIFPVLQIFGAIAQTPVADRHTYLPYTGLFYIIGILVVWVFNKKLRRQASKAVFLTILIAAVVTLSLLSRQRSLAWKDSVSLWDDVLKNYPDVATAYNNRGAGYLVKREYAKAYADFMSALSIDEDYYEAYFNLGSLYNSKGNYNEAVKSINKALQIYPGDLKAYSMLAAIYGLAGKHSEVIGICKKAIQIKDDYAEAYINLCSAYGILGNLQEAIAYGEKAVAIDSSLALAHMNLSAAYFYAKKYDLAIEYCDKAIKLGYEVKPDFLQLLKAYRK